MKEHLINIIVLAATVAFLLIFVLASCAPATTVVTNVDPSVYIGEYFDADHNIICYFTRSTPMQLQCFDLGRR